MTANHPLNVVRFLLGQFLAAVVFAASYLGIGLAMLAAGGEAIPQGYSAVVAFGVGPAFLVALVAGLPAMFGAVLLLSDFPGRWSLVLLLGGLYGGGIGFLLDWLLSWGSSESAALVPFFAILCSLSCSLAAAVFCFVYVRRTPE